MSLRPHVKFGKVIISDNPTNIPKAYLNTRKITYTDDGYPRFIQATTYVVKSKTIQGKRRPHIGVGIQMGHANKFLVVAQEFEGLVLAIEELAISLREQLPKVQEVMDKQVSDFCKV